MSQQSFFKIQLPFTIGEYSKLVNKDISYVDPETNCRDIISTGPLACGRLIWPPDHLLLDSTGPNWPPTFKT